ncbi:STAS domain-containing protein [Streptomyces sp. NBC_00024]|uniref:STAS domain-containing protein n=1 Tax=Streptomyces sp. NBC_00024 TaxID=2903612 RepID=UPI00324A7D2A
MAQPPDDRSATALTEPDCRTGRSPVTAHHPRIGGSREGPTRPWHAALPAGTANRGAMPLPQLNVYRHDHTTRALITLAGEIDLATTPLVHTALTGCLRDGVSSVDVDLTAVTFCDASGLNVFLTASRLAVDAGATLQLHCPPPIMARIIDMTGSGFLLDRPHAVRPSSHRPSSHRPPSHRAPAVKGGTP